MKTKEKKELQNKSVEELQKMIEEARVRIFSYKMEKEQGKMTDLRLFSKTQDDIARMLTVLQQAKRKEGGKHA